MATTSSSVLALGSDLQEPVTKYLAALGTPARLLKLAPTKAGHPGNAAALSPAIVLTTIAAFEGFAEDFLATVLAIQGNGLAQIARAVGNWNNPTLSEWVTRLRPLVSGTAQQALDAGPSSKITVHRVNPSGNWSAGRRPWKDVLTDSEAWMEVRHLLTHGQATGWRAERWPPPLKKNAPAASTVLRPKTAGESSLDRAGAKACARIYSLGAKHVADVVAADLSVTLDWSALRAFD